MNLEVTHLAALHVIVYVVWTPRLTSCPRLPDLSLSHEDLLLFKLSADPLHALHVKSAIRSHVPFTVSLLLSTEWERGPTHREFSTYSIDPTFKCFD